MSRRNGKRRGFGIPRVSKVNGRAGESFRSPHNQWADIRAAAARYGIEIVGGGADIDVSGTTMQRRYLREGIEAIRNGDADCLVFPKLDRYARNTLGGLQVLDEVEALGGALYFGDLDVDTSTPNGRNIFTIMLSIGEREVAEKAIELARNAREATLAGIAISPLLPGYRRNDARRVEIDPERAPFIKPLFQKRAAGHSWSAIRRWWHEETGELIKPSRLRKMIESRLYLGELRYGDTVSPIRHKALVTERLWKDAQTVPVARPPRSGESTALLAGVLVCSGCGHPMTPGRGGGGKAVLYRCQARAGATWACAQPVTIMQERVDDWVEDQFVAWASGAVGAAVTTGELEADFAVADKRIAEAEEELARYLDMTVAIDPKRARAGAESRQAAIDAAVAERKRLESESVVAGVRYEVAERWPELSTDERRQMLRAGIERITVHPASVTDRGGRARLPVADRCVITFASD